MVETAEGSGAWTDPVGRVAPLDWATDVIAAGAGTAPRLNTARRDKGGVTHKIFRQASKSNNVGCDPTNPTYPFLFEELTLVKRIRRRRLFFLQA